MLKLSTNNPDKYVNCLPVETILMYVLLSNILHFFTYGMVQ